MKQPVQQPFAGQFGIDQFDVFDGLDQRSAFDPGVIRRYDMRLRVLRRIARIEVGLPQESFAGIRATEAFYVGNGFASLGIRMRRLLT